ncbi:MAG TPA: glycosyltransferase [Terriglobales bacterium]|nr:glycosyltransferase [Terriglobales bacterium]
MSPENDKSDFGSGSECGAGQVDLRNSTPKLFLMTDSFETGGSERQFVELARSLNPTEFDVHLGCIQRRGAFLDGLGRVPEFRLGGNLYGLKSFWTRARLAQYLRRDRIVIAHAFDLYTNLTLIPAARLAGVRVVIGSHRQLGDLLSRSKSRAQAAAFRWCDVVVCNSRAAANRLVEQGFRKSRVVVIGNALPASAFGDTAPAMPRREGMLRVGMIARMNAQSKNHKVLLRAASRLCHRFPCLEFILVGDGPLRPELEREAESLGLKDHILFFGDRRDIPGILASLDVSVVPSSSESLSNAILESMAAEVPVVASRVGGNPELLGVDRGMLVAPDDDQALADAIERLLLDAGMRATLGRNGKELAKANFSLENIRDRYEELYADLLEKKNWIANRDSSLGASPRAGGGGIRLALVAASQRYVGGQSVQAELLLRNWQNDPAIEARFIPIDPSLPRLLAWVERIPFLRTLVREPVYLASLWRGLKNVDIVHIFSASYWSFLVAPFPAWLIARLRGSKTVIHYHSGEARDHLTRFRGVRSVLEDADRLVVPSEYLAGVFREFGLQAEVVPNIVDLKQFCFRERKPLRPRLICTRGFHPYYCVDVVIRAFAEIAKGFSEATLELVGKGPLEPQIRNLVQELKLSGVNFAGAVSHQEIARFYDGADIFINASSLDNMPVSILEAFASGTPVVSTAPEGMSSLIQNERTGLISLPGDAQALADNVMRLLADPELASRLTFNAYEEVGRYSWETVRQQWLKIYRTCS